MSWLNSDQYKEGFEQAKLDAQNGKSRKIMSVKQALKTITSFNSNVHMETYIAGYKEGYKMQMTIQMAKEMDVVNAKSKKDSGNSSGNNARNKSNLKNLNNSNMSNTQVYQIQEQQLNQLSYFLEVFKDEIQDRMKNYQMQVENMYANGLPQETYEKFQREHIEETNALVNSIVGLIEGQSIPFIQGNIQKMQELIQYNQ
jgi:hypothetical protein